MIHIFITGASWKVIVIVGKRIWDVLIISKEIFLLGLSSYLYFAHWVLGLNHSLPFTHPQTTQFSIKAQGPIHDLGPQPYNSPSKLRFFPLIWGEKWGFDFSGINIILSLELHMWECHLCIPWLLLTLWSSWGVINCTRQCVFPLIQRLDANPMAGISHWVLSGITPTQFRPLNRA